MTYEEKKEKRRVYMRSYFRRHKVQADNKAKWQQNKRRKEMRAKLIKILQKRLRWLRKKPLTPKVFHPPFTGLRYEDIAKKQSFEFIRERGVIVKIIPKAYKKPSLEFDDESRQKLSKIKATRKFNAY